MKIINRRNSIFKGLGNYLLALPSYIKLGSSRAFSLIEVMVAMSILTILGYFMADMIVNQQQSISGSEARMEEIEIFRQVQGLLADKRACENTFSAVSLDITPDTNGNFSDVSFDAIKDQNGGLVFEKNKSYGNGSVEITSFVIKNDTVPNTGGTGTALLSFSSERKKGNLRGRIITRDLRVQVTTDASGLIMSCFVDMDALIRTATLKAINSMLAMNNCSFDDVAETVSCEDDANMECSIETASTCSDGFGVLFELESGKLLCCKSTVQSVEETCDSVGGIYKENSCPSDYFLDPPLEGTKNTGQITKVRCTEGLSASSSPALFTVGRCPDGYAIRSFSIKPGSIATGIT